VTKRTIKEFEENNVIFKGYLESKVNQQVTVSKTINKILQLYLNKMLELKTKTNTCKKDEKYLE